MRNSTRSRGHRSPSNTVQLVARIAVGPSTRCRDAAKMHRGGTRPSRRDSLLAASGALRPGSVGMLQEPELVIQSSHHEFPGVRPFLPNTLHDRSLEEPLDSLLLLRGGLQLGPHRAPEGGLHRMPWLRNCSAWVASTLQCVASYQRCQRTSRPCSSNSPKACWS